MRAAAPTRAAAPMMETVADLEAMSTKLNPSVGYYNPTPLADMEFWGQSQEATIGCGALFRRLALPVSCPPLAHREADATIFFPFCVLSQLPAPG